jgi:hypothetical protein
VSREWGSTDVQGLNYDDENATSRTPQNLDPNDTQQDALAVAQNGGLTGSSAEDADLADAEGDEDDDMMDRISSSPSITDGGYSPSAWAAKDNLLASPVAPMHSTFSPILEDIYSSPFSEPPVHLPLSFLTPPTDKVLRPSEEASCSHHRHHSSVCEYSTSDEGAINDESEYDAEHRDRLMPLIQEDHDQGYEYLFDAYDSDYEVDDDIGDLAAYDESDKVICDPFDGAMTIPYESSQDDDDDDDTPFPEDSRFVDSGWGGECLQELEDIDFEFVYALHTFVATVEGQANATKGDTMVLLDDSNSYWWLVRVVKDSSIGMVTA